MFNGLLDGVREIHKTCPFYLNPFEHAVLKQNTFAMDAFFTPKRFTPSCCFYGVIERYRDQIDQRDLMFLLIIRELKLGIFVPYATPIALCICDFPLPMYETYNELMLETCGMYAISNGCVISYKSIAWRTDVTYLDFSEEHCFLISTEEFRDKVWNNKNVLGFRIREKTEKTYSLLEGCVLFNYYDGFKEIVTLHPDMLPSLDIPDEHVEMCEYQLKRRYCFSWLLKYLACGTQAGFKL